MHEEGRIVRDALEVARDRVADLVGVAGRQVVFTSGATESINAAVWGATRAAPGDARAVRGRRALGGPGRLVAPGAHRGARRRRCRASPGRGAAKAPAFGCPPAPALVHCQWGNHEVGTLQPVHQVVALCREAGVTVHVDAAAACGHVPTDLGALEADLVSISAHKLGGVPGAGALIVRRGSRFEPLLVGGEQERGRRAGLEALPALLAFGAAAAALTGEEEGALTTEAAASRQMITTLVGAALAVEGVAVVGPSAGSQAPPAGVPRRGRRGSRARAHRIGPRRHRRPFGLRLLVRKH